MQSVFSRNTTKVPMCGGVVLCKNEGWGGEGGIKDNYRPRGVALGLADIP
jgi:hypothetical protein